MQEEGGEEENTMKRLLRTKIVADELPMCLLFSILLSPVWGAYQQSKHIGACYYGYESSGSGT